jgi:hypothetical protein
MTAVEIVPETPANVKLKVGREPETLGLRPVMSSADPRVTGTDDQPVTAAPVASRTVKVTLDDVPPPPMDTRRSAVHSVMPDAVDHAYRGANCPGWSVINGLLLPPVLCVCAWKTLIRPASEFTQMQDGFSGSGFVE